MPTRYDPSRPVAFIHIPKTSGVALSAGLTKALSCSSLVGKFDGVIFGGFKNYSSFAPELRANLCEHWTQIPKGFGLIAGHYFASSLFNAYSDAQHITFLREARCRLLSNWIYWRKMTDHDLSWLGEFADRVRIARMSLETFLADPRIAFSTDNMMTRVLLSPRADIPLDGFIDSDSDESLLSAASQVLNRMSYADVIENARFTTCLETWLGRGLTYDPINRTDRMPDEVKSPLHAHLTERAEALMRDRTRIDRKLWAMLLQAKSPGCDSESLERCAVSRAIARYALLMS